MKLTYTGNITHTHTFIKTTERKTGMRKKSTCFGAITKRPATILWMHKYSFVNSITDLRTDIEVRQL